MDVAPAEKTELARYEIPLSESKAKEWVNSLSTTDFGESTRRVFYGLVDFNRRMVPALTRIRIAEYLRPKVDLLITNLQRHLSYQTFPLPARSQKISDLNQSLLLEFAGTYQLAALDMLNGNNEKRRSLQLAIYRVIDYLGKYLLSTYSVYIRTRETVWHDIHHMYLLACERGMDDMKFIESRNHAPSIEARYIQVNLLALFKPYSLRQEEILRIARFVEESTALVTIGREAKADELMGNFVHAAILNNDEPAVIMPYGDLPHSPTVRVFNLRPLVMQIDQMIEEIAYEHSSALILTSGLSRNLAKRMIYHLTTVRNREYNRFERSDKISVVMGMANVLKVMDALYRKKPADQQREEDLLFNNMSYGVGNSLDVEDDEEDTQADQYEQECGVRLWKVVNSSVGGYGLHWEGRESSQVRVGELVGLRDMTRADNPWMVGVVKWMESRPGRDLYCGVELLSVKVMPLTIQLLENRELSHTLPQEGLMLPSIEGVREEPVFILPAYIFRSGDQLRTRFGDRDHRVMLTALDECLGAFAHFRYRQLESVLPDAEEEDFGSLWDSL
ncbi:MAG: hypothetical protein R3E95_17565 [Thiolinea sp.]